MAQHKKGKRPTEESGLPARESSAGRLTCGRRSQRTMVTFMLVAALLGLVAVSAFFRLTASSQRPEAPTAAIVDQLSLTFPNPGFAETATRVLEQAGYTVDYYPGELVTVDFYRNLPAHDYDLIVLRVHSGVGEDTGSVSLFTSEPYAPTKYVGEQRTGRFGRARYYEGSKAYFGIYPEFVRLSMRGNFDKALVVMMGCWGLAWPDMAEAFVQRGASAVVSWDGLVSAAHTDAATERLLQHLLADRLPTEEAVAQTMAEVGPDPLSHSTLLFYPPESAASRLELAPP